MDSGPVSSDVSSSLQQDIVILKQELTTLEEKRDELLKQIKEEEEGVIDDSSSLPPQETDKTDKDQQRMHDILMAYRLTGVTIFNANEMDEGDWSKHSMENFPTRPKEMGIRFETFANASYHEPYYVMIRRRTENEAGETEQNNGTLFISKHTIPHWIPLRDIEKRYLNRDLSTFTRLISEHLQETMDKNPSPPGADQAL
ncbi:Cenp-O kinetochore centromere component-domain-containing protein [Mortierella sp. GBAus27b]|nr:Cenp-O kinetochore centromere component-domain-containing protein [Mortierella sp. GBAus27b]